MRTLILIVLAIAGTWFVSTRLNIEMPFIPEVTIEMPRTETPTKEVPEQVPQEYPSRAVIPPKPLVESPPEEVVAPTFEEIERDILRLINKIRDEYDLPALVENELYHEWAREHSEAMASSGILQHSTVNCYENVFCGRPFGEYDIASLVVKTWMESPGHRANLLQPVMFTGTVGVAQTESGTYYATFMAY